jgi:hypothetical protein
VQVRLPDGRLASAGLDDPIVPVIRRILRVRPELERDYQLVREWLEAAEREGTEGSRGSPGDGDADGAGDVPALF